MDIYYLLYIFTGMQQAIVGKKISPTMQAVSFALEDVHLLEQIYICSDLGNHLPQNLFIIIKRK